MPHDILYCGDGALFLGAEYLLGLVAHNGWSIKHIPSHATLERGHVEATRALFVLSDYPARSFHEVIQQMVLREIEQGAGLLMIGGWESFHGLGGDWDGTPLSRALPVEVASVDDRVNFDQPALLLANAAHPILDGLPWADYPPTIGGMNHVGVKSGAERLLTCQPFRAAVRPPHEFIFQPREPLPALVVGTFGQGRTAALLSDVAPHWVGGFVDWGPERVTAQGKGAPAIEVGSYYAQFWKQLLTWVGRLE